jgi:hydrogenase/urease accessory protein HupE
MLTSLGGAAAGPWVTGVLHDLYGSDTVAFVIGIGVSLVGAATIWLASPGRVRAVAGRLHLVPSAVAGPQRGSAS